MNFTKKEDDFLRANYLIIPTKRMSKMLGRNESSARQRLKILGIVVPPEVVKTFRKESYFKRGFTPANKGKKQEEYATAAAIKRSAAHRFKKGNLPLNTLFDLAVTTRIDKRGVPYKFIRIGLAKWIPLHRHNWIKEKGKIPPKMKLIFKDGDTMNCKIENLQLVTPAELMKINSLHNYPPEIKEIIQLGAGLKRKINRKLKILNDEK